MNRKKPGKRHSYLRTVFTHKCPHCREGNIFKNKSSFRLKTFMQMNDNCPVCGQKTEIEEGFYYGTGYVSYAIAVAFSASTFVAWWVLIGMSVDDNRVFWWLGTNAFLMLILQPYLMRLSRTIWLSIFVKFDTEWKSKKDKMVAI